MTRPENHPDWQGVLEDGERILWQGRPDPGIRFEAEDLPQTLMGLFMAAFALFWMWNAAMGGIVFALFGSIFLVIGGRQALQGNVIAAYIRSRTWYTLTDRRAIIATDMPVQGRRLTSYPLTPETEAQLVDGDPGSILFGAGFGRRADQRAGFKLIPDARGVWSMMQQVRRENARDGSLPSPMGTGDWQGADPPPRLPGDEDAGESVWGAPPSPRETASRFMRPMNSATKREAGFS